MSDTTSLSPPVYTPRDALLYHERIDRLRAEMQRIVRVMRAEGASDLAITKTIRELMRFHGQ